MCRREALLRPLQRSPGRTAVRTQRSCAERRFRAAGACSAEYDVVLLDRIADPRGQALDGLLQRRVLERVDAPAARADEVVMVAAAGIGGLERRRAFHVHAMDQPQ